MTCKGSHQNSCIAQSYGNGGKEKAPAETCTLIGFHNYLGQICYSLHETSSLKIL